ncbi:MAG: phosphohistidine phosphatase SixA, partial [Acidobacteriota bacterium]
SSVAQETWDEIRLYKGEPALLLVGHEPAMSHLTGFLLAVPELQIDFKKGAMVRIDVPSLGPRPRGVLKWMLAPRLAG